MCGSCLWCDMICTSCLYEEICVLWVDVSFVHSSHLVRQVCVKLIYSRANGSWISMIRYLILKIIYRNTSNIGIWRVREWIWVEILPKFLSVILKIIAENLENNVQNFRKSFPKNFEHFEKYFGHFRGVFCKISRSIF